MSHHKSTGLHGSSTYEIFHNYTVIDTETTGIAYSDDRIIELSAIKIVNGECISEFSALVNPEISIPYNIVEKTGITNDMVNDSPSIDKILPDFLAFVGNDNIVGHNVSFDLNFINFNCGLYNFDAIMNDYCDTRWIAYHTFPDAIDCKLETIANILNIEQSTAHRALADCYTTYKCYERIKEIQREAKPRRRTFAHNTYESNMVSNIAQPKASASSSPKPDICFCDVSSKNICLSGNFETASKDVIAEMLISKGAVIKSTMSSLVDILLIGELGNDKWISKNHGRKELKARELNDNGCCIEIIKEHEFFFSEENLK